MNHHAAVIGFSCSAITLLTSAETALAQDRLNYPQQQALRRIQGRYNDIKRTFEKSHPKYVSEKPQLKGMIVPPSYYAPYLASIADMRKKIAQIDDDFKSTSLPTGHPEVKPTFDGVQSIRSTLDTWEKEMKAAKAASDNMADPKSYPGLEEAFSRLKELEKSFQDANFGGRVEPLKQGNKFQNNKFQEAAESRKKAFALFMEVGKIQAWLKEAFKKYRPYIIASGGKASPFYRQYASTANALKSFFGRADKFAVSLTGQFTSNMKSASDRLANAVKHNSDSSRRSIENHLSHAKVALDVLAAFPGYPPAKLKPYQDQYASESKSIMAGLDDLEEKIIAETRAPAEVYEKSDREELRSKMKAEWKRVYPDEKILAIRFHSSG